MPDIWMETGLGMTRLRSVSHGDSSLELVSPILADNTVVALSTSAEFDVGYKLEVESGSAKRHLFIDRAVSSSFKIECCVEFKEFATTSGDTSYNFDFSTRK